MIIWTVADVLARSALGEPLQGSIDLVEVMLALVVFLALPECFRRDEQVTVDVVDHFVSDRTVGVLKRLSTLCTMAFLGLLGFTGIQPLRDAWTFGDAKPDLPIPIFILLGAIEMALLVSLLVCVSKLFKEARHADRREAT